MNLTEDDIKQIRKDIKKGLVPKEAMKKYRIAMQVYLLIKSQIPESELPKKHKDKQKENFHELTEDEARAIVEDLKNGILVEDIMRKRKITIYQIARAQKYLELVKLRYHGID